MNTVLKRAAGDLLHRSGALAAARAVRTSVLRRPALTILCYHRVTEEAPAFSPLSLPPAAFEAQVAYLARTCDIWPLLRVADWIEGRAVMRRDTVAITFDDGYADNHLQAAPILERHGAPATFFVTTGPMKARRALWWDDLRRLVEGAPPATFDRPGMPAEIRALLAAYAADAGPGRTEIGRRLLVLLRTAPEPERHRVLDTLRAGGPGHGRAEDNPTEAGRMDDAATMDAGQVVDLVRRGFEIGAHGVTHAALSTLGPARLREEIRGCRDDLRALGIEPASFAYPYGDAGARDDVVVRAVAEAGFRIAVTTEERAVPRGSEALRLPRKVISPQTLGQVATKLERMAWGA